MPVLRTSGSNQYASATTPVGTAQAESKVVLSALVEASIHLADLVRGNETGKADLLAMAQYQTLAEVVEQADADLDRVKMAMEMVRRSLWDL